LEYEDWQVTRMGMLAMTSPRLVTDGTEAVTMLLAVRLVLLGSITRHCSTGSSLIASSRRGTTQTWTGSGLSLGPTTPVAGTTLNMLHTDCGQPGVGVNVNLPQQCQLVTPT